MWPEATFIPTDLCAACGGGGCRGGGAAAELLCELLPGVIDKAQEAELIRKAVRQTRKRRPVRFDRDRYTVSRLAELIEGVTTAPEPTLNLGFWTWTICATCVIFPPGPRSFPAGLDPNVFNHHPPGTWIRVA